MAKETDRKAADTPPDSNINSKPDLVGTYDGPHQDRLLIPNVGLLLSKHAIYDYERERDKFHTEATSESPYNSESYYKMLIPESAIIKYAETIAKYSEMERAANDYRSGKRKRIDPHDHEDKCYPETDTIDPALNPDHIRNRRNQFDIDRSQSTIGISVTSSTGRYLNASTVPHHHYVSIRLNSPDGRSHCRVALTFDQFAAALVSNSDTPCTYDHYWGMTDDSVALREVVKEPESIKERMKQRLNTTLDEVHDRFNAVYEKLSAKIEDGKSMPKTQLAELLKDLQIIQSHMVSNRDFTVHQAAEEVTSIAERAAISVALEHDLTTDEVLRNSAMVAILTNIVPDKPRLEVQSNLLS